MNEKWFFFQGSLAEVAVADESDIAKKSSKLSFNEAAALPIAYITSLQGLRDYGKLTFVTHMCITFMEDRGKIQWS